MYNQGPAVGRINLSFNGLEEQDPSQKPRMGQPAPPPYQEHPNAVYYAPGPYPNPSGYPSQPYGAPGGPQAPYAPQGPYFQQQPDPGMSVYPQRPDEGHTGVTVQPTVFMTSTPAVTPIPDYLCFSIFNLLFCCCPLGLAAIICSCSTRDANIAGQQDSAHNSSRFALILNTIALIIGITVYSITTAFLLFVWPD